MKKKNDIMDITKTGMMGAVGSKVLSSSGDTYGQQGISAMTSSLPTVGLISGTKMTLKSMKKLKI